MVDAMKTDRCKPVDGLRLTNLTGTCTKGIELANMKNVHLSGGA